MATVLRSFSCALVFVFVAVLVACTSEIPAGQCEFTAQCPAGMVCADLYCRAPCVRDSDCGPTARCAGVAENGQRACVPNAPGADSCTRDSDCSDGRACLAGSCQPHCAEDYDCQVINPFSTCRNRVCVFTCISGVTADCDGNARTGCEVRIAADPRNCGACGRRCSTGMSCVEGRCTGACPMGRGDCDGDASNGCETDLTTSVMHCGACGTACALTGATASCRAGRCTVAACTEGRGNCDAMDANGCEAELNSSPQHCGTCGTRCDEGMVCRSGVCEGDCGTLTLCPPGMCADLTSSTTHCGRCGNACRPANATPACMVGMCTIGACNAGFGDCDRSAANGCEVNLQNTVAHCGACGNVCNSTNGVASCTGGRCGITCNEGFADCDGDAANGCEVNLATSPANCGACGRPCSLANATATCVAGTCGIAACTAGFADCNERASDGCEVALATSPMHCGRCGNTCSLARATATCTSGMCAVGRCEAGWGDCDGMAANGCETNLTSTTSHCGSCGTACALRNAVPACTMGACTVARCDTGWGDCDGMAANGCETNVTTSSTHCGRCGATCPAGQVCTAGVCARACTPGVTTDCGGACVNLQTDINHCGACGTACPGRPNAVADCSRGVCGFLCLGGFGDCDGVAANGCETDLRTSPMHCGACRNACAGTGGAGTCTAGRCGVMCAAGRGDCDGVAANGCEVDLTTTPTHCGACGRACSLANATATCVGSMCAIGMCNTGWGNCDGLVANGCETPVSMSTMHCGRCGTMCGTANGTPACATGACSIVCNAGFGDCDRVNANGCEVDLRVTAAHCGACGRACALPNATATCAAGACAVGTCNTGFGNCDAVADNGCETNLNTSNAHCGACGRMCSAGTACSMGTCVSACAPLTSCGASCVNTNTDPNHCGACGRVCTFPSAIPACTMATCGIMSCNPNFGNCDGMLANGCEVNLATSVAHCGACGMACSFTNASANCVAGRCGLGACNPGFGNCDGMAANGCEVNTNTSTTHCGACGTTCVAPMNGSVSCMLGRCVQACNPGFYPQPDEVGIICLPILPPRPVTPSSFASATTRRPVFTWVLAAGTTGARLRVCTDRSCTAAPVLDVTVSGSSYTPTVNLPPGRLFWVLTGVRMTLSGITVSPVWQVFVPPRDAARAADFAVAPDYNGDGFADLAITTGDRPGVFVLNGSAMGIATTLPPSLPGYSESRNMPLAPLGDVNGDGFGDLLVGAVDRDNTIRVFYGSARGLGTPQTITNGTDGTFGAAVAWAGDVNNDGFADAIVGSCLNSDACRDRAYVYLGSASGLRTAPIELVGIGGFGVSVAGVGQLNDDGFDDVVVASSSHVFEFRGSATGIMTTAAGSLRTGSQPHVSGARDVNGDGFGDMALTHDVGIKGSSNELRFYRGGVSGLATATPLNVTRTFAFERTPSLGVGDVNGDGFDDLMYLAQSDSVQVFYGGADGPTSRSAWTFPAPGGTRYFGRGVWLTGDVNGDRFWDVSTDALIDYATCEYQIHLFGGSAMGLPSAATTRITLSSTDCFDGGL